MKVKNIFIALGVLTVLFHLAYSVRTRVLVSVDENIVDKITIFIDLVEDKTLIIEDKSNISKILSDIRETRVRKTKDVISTDQRIVLKLFDQKGKEIVTIVLFRNGYFSVGGKMFKGKEIRLDYNELVKLNLYG